MAVADGTKIAERWAERYNGILIAAAESGGEFGSEEDEEMAKAIEELSAAEERERVLREVLERIQSISRIAFSKAAAKGNTLAGALAKDVAEKAASALATPAQPQERAE